MLAPTSATVVAPWDRMKSTAPSTSCQIAGIWTSPCEQPPSPPGQYPRKSYVRTRYPWSARRFANANHER